MTIRGTFIAAAGKATEGAARCDCGEFFRYSIGTGLVSCPCGWRGTVAEAAKIVESRKGQV